MPSYVITGTSRGIGFEFMRQLSADPASTVIGLVRNKEQTVKKVAAEINRPNIHIIQADLADYESLERAAAETAKITGGSVDYLIANAALISEFSQFDPLETLAKNPKAFNEDLNKGFQVNVVGNINLFNLFLPLVRKGQVKKVIAISSGMADPDLVTKYEVWSAASYTISKAALNMAVAKFAASYNKEGILFMCISPGVVDTQDFKPATDAGLEGVMDMMRKFSEYAPSFKGPISPEESVEKVLAVINKASVANGDGGSFVSHFGNKQWI